jgi:endonuclease/exonuclease/phosphatase family metal-dependent hydrolase
MWTLSKSVAFTRATTALAGGVVALTCMGWGAAPTAAAAHPAKHRSGKSSSGSQYVSVMSYNLLQIKADGRREGGTRVAPWSKRRGAQVRLIEKASPDVISVQEGGSWVHAVRGPRQVDDLRAHLGGTYGLAHTEVPPNRPHYFRTGCYILYKRADFKTAGHGGHWALGDRRWAAYQVLKSRASGAKFLVVNPHLVVASRGGTDAMRTRETRTMYQKARDFAARRNHLPIVFAGDFNSDPGKKHARNAPSLFMRSKGYLDAFKAARSRSNARYNSANGYQRTPPKHRLRLDYIFTKPDIRVLSWRMLLNLSHGKYAGVIPSDHNPIVATMLIPY